MKRTRRNHGAACKGDKTLTELAEQFSVHPTQITEWKQQLLARAVSEPPPIRPSDLSLSLARPDDHTAEPRVGG
jgi:transposase